MPIKTELHCHNVFSNFHLGDDESPFDCNISIGEQLERTRELNLDAVFVTNHNTLDGFEQMLQFKNNHQKYKHIQIYPAEEISTDQGEHVLAYGIHKEIKPGLSFEEVTDEIKKQNGISSAPHPFSLLDALREKAALCDMIEVFNSNNLDIISNAKATNFAFENKMTQVAGSDSHVVSTMGRCVNLIDSENKLDDLLHAMRHKKIKIQQTGYALKNETMAHLKYKIDNSNDYLLEYIKKHYPNSKWLLSLLLKMYHVNPNSFLWTLFYKLAIFLMRRISNKINFQNFDTSFLKERNLSTMFKMAL